MAAVPQVTLNDSKQFLEQIGYLAVINGKGPFAGYSQVMASRQFFIRENIKDVAVGDDAFSGSEWGKVVTKTGNVTDGYTFEVKYPFTVLPAGVDHKTWNPARTIKYSAVLPAAAELTGLIQANQFPKLASIGVVVVAQRNPSIPTAPSIALDTNITVISAAAPNITLDFNIGGVSVQKKVAGVNSGAPVVANASGVAVMPNGNTVGQSVSYVVSKTGHNTTTIGPIVVTV